MATDLHVLPRVIIREWHSSSYRRIAAVITVMGKKTEVIPRYGQLNSGNTEGMGARVAVIPQ